MIYSKKGILLYCDKGEVVEKHTSPPAYFTDATLLAAMTGISRYVTDPQVKKILKDTDGLGTEATRAEFIELLFRRRILQREGKSVKATETGQALINVLPQGLASPDLTAKWESSLSNIADNTMSYQQFLQPLLTDLNAFVEQAANCDNHVFTKLPKTSVKKRFSKRGGKSTFKKSNYKKTASNYSKA